MHAPRLHRPIDGALHAVFSAAFSGRADPLEICDQVAMPFRLIGSGRRSQPLLQDAFETVGIAER